MRVLIVSANKEDNLGDILIYESIKEYLKRNNCQVDSINYRLQYYDLNRKDVFSTKDNLKDKDKDKDKNNVFSFLMKVKEIFKKNRSFYVFLQIIYFLSRVIFYFKIAREKYKLADVVVIGGGQIIMDTKYSILFSLNLLFHIFMSRVFSKKILFLGVGIASKFNFSLTEMVIKYGFKCADSIMVRDVYSFHRAVKILGESKKISFSIDLAVLFPWEPHNDMNNVVGLSTLPYYDARYFPVSDEMKFKFYKNAIKECCYYIQKNTSYGVILIPTTSIDAIVAKEIDSSLVDESHNITELINKINSCSYFIATRMHSFIISVALGKPALCFYWDDKIKGFVSSFCGFGIDEYLFYEKDFSQPATMMNRLTSLDIANSYNLSYHRTRLTKWINSNVLAN